MRNAQVSIVGSLHNAIYLTDMGVRVRRSPQGGGVPGYGFHKGRGVWRTPIYIYFQHISVSDCSF